MKKKKRSVEKTDFFRVLLYVLPYIILFSFWLGNELGLRYAVFFSIVTLIIQISYNKFYKNE